MKPRWTWKRNGVVLMNGKRVGSWSREGNLYWEFVPAVLADDRLRFRCSDRFAKLKAKVQTDQSSPPT